jgi:hypothetical protein
MLSTSLSDSVCLAPAKCFKLFRKELDLTAAFFGLRDV